MSVQGKWLPIKCNRPFLVQEKLWTKQKDSRVGALTQNHQAYQNQNTNARAQGTKRKLDYLAWDDQGKTAKRRIIYSKENFEGQFEEMPFSLVNLGIHREMVQEAY